MSTTQVNIPTIGSTILLKHSGRPTKAKVHQLFARNNDTYIIYAVEGKRYPYTAKLSDTKLNSADYNKYRVENSND